MKNVLFVCSQNELRSPTAERVFSGRKDIEVASAGLTHDAPQPVTPELLIVVGYNLKNGKLNIC